MIDVSFKLRMCRKQNMHFKQNVCKKNLPKRMKQKEGNGVSSNAIS